MTRRVSDPQIEGLLERIRGLVREREALGCAGASERELKRKSAEIWRLQARLAHEVRRVIGELG